jgi:hypothetical protein
MVIPGLIRLHSAVDRNNGARREARINVGVMKANHNVSAPGSPKYRSSILLIDDMIS